METGPRKTNNTEELHRIEQEKLYEVVDINFGYKQHREVEILTAMDGEDRARNTTIHEMKVLQSEGKEIPESMEEKVVDCYKRYNILKKEYVER